MKQYFKDLIRKLYFTHCDPDIVAMTRKQLELFRAPLDLKKMPKADREKFAHRSKELMKNQTLNQIFDMTVAAIENDMQYKTQDKNIIYDRFSINGVALAREKIMQVASMVAEEDNEEFDKFAVV